MLDLVLQELAQCGVIAQPSCSAKEVASLIQKCPDFSWSSAARRGGLSRTTLYNWCYTTYARESLQKMSPEDINLVKHLVVG